MENMLKISVALFYFALYAYAQKCEFSCIDDQSAVIIQGKHYRCPIGQVCNRLNVTLDGKICRRCLTLTEMCGEIYTCGSEENEVIFRDEKMTCEPYFKCSSPNPTCEPCERISCNQRYWQCSTEDPTRFFVNNIRQECAPGFVCNRYAVAPCNPCIDQGNYWNLAGPLLYGRTALAIN